MGPSRIVRISKYLSRHLRHRPERIGLVLGPGGWVTVDDLLAAAAADGFALTRAELVATVAENDKRRYEFDETGERIRASQGHSVDVDLGLPPATPPYVLFHGTVARHLPSIRRDGLRPQSRHDVHLSADEETAHRVGARRGEPVILRVDAARMVADGHVFRVSANGVWLVPAVPPEYLREPA